MGLGDIKTSVSGLDDVLAGGLTAHRVYLIEGMPGSGKTTLSIQFLMAGARLGERVLYVTLSESKEEIHDVAASHGWSLDGVDIHELTNGQENLEPDAQYSVFHPSEVELSHTTRQILGDIERVQPARVVFDSLSELRLLAGSPLRFRRQILALKQFFAGRQCTVLLLDDLTTGTHDLHVQSLAHGCVLLEQFVPDYGTLRRRLRILKYRGHTFRGGYHDYIIRRGGITVFPRLVAHEHRQDSTRTTLSCGVDALDALLGGGLDSGSSTLITGAAGTGKSTISALFAQSIAQQGGNAILFIFDESPQSMVGRMSSLGVDMSAHLAAGRIRLRPVDPAELSPGELIHEIRRAVDQEGCSVVVIDSLNGYLHAMPSERFLVVQLHELLTFLGQRGVVTLLVNAQIGLMGPTQSTVDASYLADAVLLTRYVREEGRVRLALSVLKKRSGSHERSIRPLLFEPGRIAVGEPMLNYRGVLSDSAPQS